MEYIKKAINHLCYNITNGGKDGAGWRSEDIRNLSEGILLLAQAANLMQSPAAPEAEAPDWRDAVRIIHDTCSNAEDCDRGSCPMYDWCKKNIPNVTGNIPPNAWTDPEESHD